MRVGIPAENAPRERRVAAGPTVVKQLADAGIEVAFQAGAGDAAGLPDADYSAAGATVVADALAAHNADVVWRVGPPTEAEIGFIPEGSVYMGFADPLSNLPLMRRFTERRITVLALETVPRTTLAQSIDALSSQATAGGYAAVLLAASTSPRFFPMLVTAAGTIRPSKVLILGVGVAGLQAIATARRLGAQVSAYDIRPETREQVESLGARFVEAPTERMEEGGYARAVDSDMQQRQFEALAPHVAGADVVITTAQVPGRRAPLLITTDMVRTMKPGAVIVDMAAASGGNVEPSRPGETVDVSGVTILGPENLPATVPADATRMLGRNLKALFDLIVTRPEGGTPVIALDLSHEIIDGCAVTHAGEVRNARLRAALGLEASE